MDGDNSLKALFVLKEKNEELLKKYNEKLGKGKKKVKKYEKKKEKKDRRLREIEEILSDQTTISQGGGSIYLAKRKLCIGDDDGDDEVGDHEVGDDGVSETVEDINKLADTQKNNNQEEAIGILNRLKSRPIKTILTAIAYLLFGSLAGGRGSGADLRHVSVR